MRITNLRAATNSFITLILMSTAAFGNPKVGFMETEITTPYGPTWITIWDPTSNKEKAPSVYDFYLDGGLVYRT